MRVLQIGLGRWGQNHLRSWRRLGVELLVCDEDPRTLDGVPEAARHDATELLERVDAVDIVTPAHTHGPLIEKALEASCHVFVEKPITPSAKDALRLAARAAAGRRVLQVGHIFRFAPELVALRSALAAGEIGEPHTITSHFLGFKRPRSDGGVAISDAIHLVDVASWLLGREPDRVTCATSRALGRGLDDAAFLALEYGDCLAHIEVGYFAPEPRRDVMVCGSEGVLSADLLARERRLRLYEHAHRRSDEGGWQAVEGPVRELPYASSEPLLAELIAFVDACTTGSPGPHAADGVAGAAAVAVVEAALRSAAEHRSVEIDRPPLI